MQRRPFLVQLSASLASAVGVGVLACAPDQPASPLDTPLLLAPLGADAVRRIGFAYLDSTGTPRDVNALRAAMAKDLQATSRRDPGASAGNIRAFDALMQDDFRAERTVWVDHWLLSVNEARRYALYALLSS